MSVYVYWLVGREWFHSSVDLEWNVDSQSCKRGSRFHFGMKSTTVKVKRATHARFCPSDFNPQIQFCMKTLKFTPKSSLNGKAAGNQAFWHRALCQRASNFLKLWKLAQHTPCFHPIKLNRVNTGLISCHRHFKSWINN